MNIELTRQLRSFSQLLSLVRAVVDAHDSDEQHYIEWKGPLDLRSKEAHYSIAKCILAMANRPVEKASKYFGGCGYMIIGAEPGRLHNVSIPDMADLEPGVQKYTSSDGPSWSGHAITVDGSTVLVIVVEPPAAGDHMHPLARQWDKHQAGTVFVRHQARSEPMNVGDLRGLEQRLLDGSVGLSRITGIEVCVRVREAVQVLSVTEQDIGDAVLAEREALEAANSRVGDGSGVFPRVAVVDREADEDYRRRSVRYLRDFERALPNHLLHAALASLEGGNSLVVTNASKLPVTDLRLVLRFSDDVRVYEEALEVEDDLPRRPVSPSKAPPFASFARVYSAPQYAPDLGLMQRHISISSDHREATFRIPSLHPFETAETDSFILLAMSTPDLPDAEKHRDRSASVVISAGDRSEAQEGSLVFATTGTDWGISELRS
ncbi:hypothetical protein [Clavibacter nebraskensis]|uniref:hypothetical protein n=1 Tax=Clavibacter nebraskensis TaxID=31963 RepID=UPI003F850A32